MGTQKYIDSEKSNSWLDSFLTGQSVEQEQPIVEVKQEPEIDIDPDIEKEITLIQEAKLNQSIKEDVKKVVKVVEEPKKSVSQGLADFFSAIDNEKKQVKENVEKSEKKIIELEKLFDNLKKEKKKAKKKKRELLLEPEKVKEEKQPEKEINIVSLQNVEVKKDKPEDMMDRVQKEISEMKVANELEKDKIKTLDRITSLDELKKEFVRFKDVVTNQMSTIGGGGETQLKFLDDVDTSAQQNAFALKYNSSTGKYDFGEVATDFSAIDEHILPAANNTYDLGSSSKRWRDIYLSSDSIDLAGATISSDGTGTINIAATGATLPAGSKAGVNELAVISSSGDTLQAARVVPFFSASGGLSTKNTDFEFNATVDSRFTFTGTKTFTLSNGTALADSDPTLFQF
jgi:hypothetical protein